MKKLFILLGMLFISAVTFAQSVTLSQEDLAKLDPNAKAQIVAIQTEKQIDGTLQTTGKWVGLGKEIGTAMNESLTAITTTASNFAETKLGKFTMFLVAWKVIGTDFLQLVIGIVWIVMILSISLYLYRNNCERVKIMSRKWNKEGKGWETTSAFTKGDIDFKVTAIVILCIGLSISILIIFA